MEKAPSIRHELRPGDLGRLIALHGSCYEHLPGFGLHFEAFVARTVAEYILDAGGQGRIWLAERGEQLVGCTAVVLRDGGAGQLRWVLVAPSTRGIGLGKELVQRALDYCRKEGCSKVFLHTTDGLPESQALYDSLGFVTVFNEQAELWDGERSLVEMELALT